MELQNITVDFVKNEVFSMFNEEHYQVDVLDSILPVKVLFENTYNIAFEKVVIQLTEDQHLCEPRILCQNPGNDLPPINLADIKVEHPDLMLALHNIRLEIEVKIQEQIDAKIVA
jgi:hypothetical protein